MTRPSLLLAVSLALGGCQKEGLELSTDGPNGPHLGPGQLTDASQLSDPLDAGNHFDTITTDQRATFLPDLASPDLTIAKPDVPVADTRPFTQPDLAPDISPDLLPDRAPDLFVPNQPDLKQDLVSPDLPTNYPIGKTCSKNSDCHSSFCTDGVCCEVAKCVDTCVPGSSTCAPYSGFTCAPYGTCRGY